jgi:phosphatidylserine decarboxylase
MSHVEITSMLDSLGSTLSRSTIDSFFNRHGKTPSTGELTIEEAVVCLEREVSRPVSQKKRLLQPDDSITMSDTECVTPMYDLNRSHQELVFNGPAVGGLSKGEAEKKLGAGSHDDPNQGLETQPGQPSGATQVIGQVPYPAGLAPEQVDKLLTIVHAAQASGGSSSPASESDLTSSSLDNDDGVERVINIKTCPLCHQPRLKHKGEIDIVTHLAICASNDWAKVDRIMVGNFVTASQAKRKWYTLVMNKITTGVYSLGAVSGLRSPTSGSQDMLMTVVELGQHHRTKPHDWSAGRREDANIRPAGYPPALQGYQESGGRRTGAQPPQVVVHQTGHQD